jgi:addiction module HigA family antidote
MHNPAHLGEVLREWLPEGMTITKAAKELKVSRAMLSKVLNGKAGVTAGIALRLSVWLGTTPDVWLGMQTQWDLWLLQAPASAGKWKMPTIPIFYGIQIMMYFYDNGKHNIPHIHAEYQDDEAVYSILDGEVISGSLPRKQTRLVQTWIELYQESLLIDWKLAVAGQEPFRIEPLR